ncbi:Excinuclease ABC subunit A [Dissulfuribacter thermophilus]|uniref:UvrABC system protein A n=1 Tax=Dissulfuribacter thermophilus TaxID=1156395 RepID=A0A1B9F6F8_9BACT|nr:excinuclease ABC subunit UvrA [Dissulfuribacter thermophilus]OCC15502.1 Excinuclease ABC subunit A [Dissulfuribacter thermophilus]
MDKKIVLRGLFEHNLKNIDLDIFLGRIISVIGPSGAGKSTLVFDTIHAESERRYIETFSPYVRQFLERKPRPKASFISGLPASIAVLGRNPVRNARSTVATLSEITFPVRHLFFRLSHLECPGCGSVVKEQGLGDVVDLLKGLLEAEKEGIFIIGAEVEPKDFEALDFESRGYSRCIVEGEIRRLDELVDTHNLSTISVIVDRIRFKGPDDLNGTIEQRIREALELGFLEGKGRVVCYFLNRDKNRFLGPFPFSRNRQCARCGLHFSPPTLALFSFNTPAGACPECQGFGRGTGIDWNLVIPDPSKSIVGGAILPLESWEYEKGLLLEVLEDKGVDPRTPWRELPDDIKQLVKYGHGPWPGMEALFEELERYRYKAHIRILLSRYRAYTTCPECNGTRFRKEALYYRLLGKNIGDFYSLSVDEALRWLRENNDFFQKDRASATLFRELENRLETLSLSGVGYLGLNRQSRTLSGGEMLRVTLARALGNALKDTLYCLDEPSRGLHPHDVLGIKKVLEGLWNRGNTILTVTHEPQLISSSHGVIALGPGSGKEGGEVTYQGPPDESLLLDYVATDAPLPAKTPGQISKEDAIIVKEVRANNLKSVNVRIPLGRLTVVTGVSGSGKSSLVEEVLFRAVKRYLGEPVESPGAFSEIVGLETISEVVLVDQSSLTRTPRATVATYSGVFDGIRKVFANTPQAKAMGLKPGNFSFNSPLGRCENCKGLGVEVLEMQFLPDVELLCPVCNGTRLKPEIRSVPYKGVRFDQCLAMTVKEAMAFFKDVKKVASSLKVINDLGLGHLTLDQRLSTLSGGEAQRLRLTKAFLERDTPGHTLYILDEPTRGLHPREVDLIIRGCHALIRKKNASVVVVEHNPRFIRNSHWLIELGPEGGEKGGYLIYEGEPQGLYKIKESKTAPFLQCTKWPSSYPKKALEPQRIQEAAVNATIEIKGARHHNLKSIDVSIPREKFVVITGPSGSGKSTLAFDIIHSEGERRYIECLSSYVRQFLKLYERPDVDELVGLSPSVAIEQRKARSGPMSTVATLTEVAHFLRLLYSKVSQARCPGCGLLLKETKRDRIIDEIKRRFKGCKVYLMAPRVRKRKGFFKNVLEQAKISGASGLMIDGKFYPITNLPELDRFSIHSISWLFGPISPDESGFEAVFNKAIYYGGGEIGIMDRENQNEEFFSERRSCARCGMGVPDPDPLLFSFNTQTGRCPRCNGTGREPSEGKACKECRGTRLSKDALSWVIDEKNIGEVLDLEVEEAKQLCESWLRTPPWSERLHELAEPLVKEVVDRLGFLIDVGLGYLSLSRSGDTLSGGEAQRIRLAAQIGSGLTGLTVVLDEPTIGLHPLDNRRLLKVFKRLKDAGNTVIVVEHDEETIRGADWVIDLGPGGGKNGGRVVAEGPPSAIEQNTTSLTGLALRERRHKRKIYKDRDVRASGLIRLSGISCHNIRDEEVEIPLGAITAIVGVSGSGKSTLLEEVLYKNLRKITSKKGSKDLEYLRDVCVDGIIRQVLMVDSSPIGRTPRSCVLTYLKLFDFLRDLFAKTPLARARGYSKSTFSFNTEGGRCPTCKGQGAEEVKLGFLPPVYITCPDCGGKRFKDEVLQVRWSGKNISECLSMTVDEALSFFKAHPRLKRSLGLLSDLGLGYLELGQRSPHLSGGEAQRLKLSRELMARSPEGVVYLLDEPTTGLHMKDVERLMRHLRKLCELGNTVIIVEHNVDVILGCDYVIELGPGGGKNGGKVIFQGGIEAFIAGEKRTPTQKVLLG